MSESLKNSALATPMSLRCRHSANLPSTDQISKLQQRKTLHPSFLIVVALLFLVNGIFSCFLSYNNSEDEKVAEADVSRPSDELLSESAETERASVIKTPEIIILWIVYILVFIQFCYVTFSESE